jgi:isoquinoline 1-oxidoreductase subunit alpha
MRFLPPPESGSDLFHLRSTSSNPRSNDRVVEMRVSTAFVINGDHVELDADADTPLLWIIRDRLKLTGTKFGCGIAQCGACTVHLDGRAVRSCQTSLADVAGRRVTTVEGLSANSDHPLQKAWITEQVPQCGYCQSGQIMQAAALLNLNPKPTRREIVERMDGIICRCGTYPRVIRAIERVVGKT